ncbi:putative serine protease PepD [Kitasatospora sp. MAA4]|uniref:S1C family serine protease n=1 Tax=Kitasatospora sp. MAA4 TaxID=3035093 RepID=UPI002473EC20|nr:trypsin-like peptidase domain-containing protein [Kitasatospora sp. MAA4]MDH6132874.1 putative serine protease PepD [Kitasatospora sp. MAA4]
MSTEHESGPAGPQEEQPSSGHGEQGGTPPVGEPMPTLAFTKLNAPEAAPEPAVSDPQPTAAEPSAAPSYLDAPPPVVPAPAAPAAASYLDAPPPVPPVPAVPLAAEAPENPYAAPTQTGTPITPGVPAASAPHAEHHPFGAGQPLGGWGTPPAGPGGPGTPGYPGEYPGAYGAPAARRKGRGGLVALVAAVALVAGLAGGLAGAAIKDDNSGFAGGSSHSSTTIMAGDNTKTLNRAPDSVAGIAAKALPSTVTIKAVGSQESGTGTGFVFDTQGHILTNNHVVAPAANGGKLSVKFSDGSTYAASVVGQAKGYDVAVVKLDNPPTSKLVPLPLADSDQVAVGDVTIAIGAPYDLEGTVTSGIVSAKNRPVASGDESGAQVSYMNALQTDASINPGNSGGPLLNASGAVIGINSAIQSNSGGGSTGQAGSIGLGFAIPINQAKRVAQMLIQTGTPVYATLGVLRNDDYQGDGAQIQTAAIQNTPAVTPGGPADKAGLKPGDVITKLGGVTIDNGPALVSEIWTHQPGDQVQVEYTRNGQPATTTVTLGSRSGDN